MRKTTIITDPIHQVMNLGSDPGLRAAFKNVIDTRTFQRLRRITQLGLTSYVFPGATHTRFSHCIGTAYLAHSVLTHLREWVAEGEDRNEINGVFNEVMMAALLHDVGHGPFSHSFERVLKQYSWAPLHEDWTRAMISSEGSEIRQRLEESGVNAKNVASVFVKPATADGLPAPYRQIVSSQLDVDRMDYLVRDSHFAGVAIGRFDAHYLINSIVLVNHDPEGGVRTLGLTPKGIKAYEAFLLARQLMNRTVYYHHNVQVLEFMVEHLLRLVIKNSSRLEDDKKVSPFIPNYLKKVVTAIEVGVSSKASLMDASCDDYIRLTEDGVWSLISAIADSASLPDAQCLAQKLLTRKILPHFVVGSGKKELLKESLVQDGFVEEKDFHLLDLKTTMYKGSGDEHVFVVDSEGNIEEVSQHSETISAFRDRPEAECLLIVIDGGAEGKIKEVSKKRQLISPWKET